MNVMLYRGHMNSHILLINTVMIAGRSLLSGVSTGYQLFYTFKRWCTTRLEIHHRFCIYARLPRLMHGCVVEFKDSNF